MISVGVGITYKSDGVVHGPDLVIIGLVSSDTLFKKIYLDIEGLTQTIENGQIRTLKGSIYKTINFHGRLALVRQVQRHLNCLF